MQKRSKSLIKSLHKLLYDSENFCSEYLIGFMHDFVIEYN